MQAMSVSTHSRRYHIIVTDLDGDGNVEVEVEAETEASRIEVVMVIHGQGDNIRIIRSLVYKLYNVMGSTQAVPLANVHNSGGFTDGDRCVFLAREPEAGNIKFPRYLDLDPDLIRQIQYRLNDLE